MTHYARESKELINRITQRQIQNINNFEKQWKLQANPKFTIMRLEPPITDQLMVNDEIIGTKLNGKF